MFPKTELEIWCHNEMARFHNHGLELKDEVKRQYHSGIAQGFARVLDRLLKQRKKEESRAAHNKGCAARQKGKK